MDTIKFEVTNIAEIKNTDIKQCDVALFFNDLPIRGLLNANEAIAASRFNVAEFDLFTCSCGVPGCAGYQEPVKQTKESGLAIWKFPECYKTDKNEYRFDHQQFTSAFDGLFSKLESLESDNIYAASNIDLMGDDDREEAVSTSIRKGVDRLTGRFQADEDLHVALKGHNLYGKEFRVGYGDQMCQYSIDLADLVCAVMNMYPYTNEENTYLETAKTTAQAIERLINGDRELFNKVVALGYRENGLTAYDFIDRYVHDIAEEVFDINQIMLLVDSD